MDKVYISNVKPIEVNSVQAPLPEANETKEEINTDSNDELTKKTIILKNYTFIDFITLEKINFNYNSKEGIENISFCPNGELLENGEEYYIFFNIDHTFNKLQKYYNQQLNDYLNTHNYILGYDKEELLKKSKSKCIETRVIHVDDRKIRFFYGFIKAVCYNFSKEIFDKANILASNCAILNSLLDDKVLKLQGIKIKKDYISLISIISSKEFSFIKESFRKIYKSEETDLNKVKNIEKFLNDYLTNYKKTNSKNEILYTLYQANNYLGKFERDLQNKDYLTLKIMDKVRKQLNKYFMVYRFESKKNFSSFYNIKINSCKIILRTEDSITLYIDRLSTQNYIKKIYETLEQKASNLQRNYQLDAFKEIELRDIAQSKDFESYENLLLSYEEKINEKENEKNKLKIDGNRKLLKGGVSLVKKGTEIYIESQKKSLLITNNIVKTVTNKIKEDKEDKENKENKENKEDNKEDKGNTEGKENKENKEDKENNKEKETKISEYLNFIKELNIENSIDDIFEGFNSFCLKDKIEKEIKLIQRQKKKLKEKKDYLKNFIGILKLYNLLKKKKYDERNDYEGIFLTGKIENKKFNKLLSEYKIEEF